MVEAWHLSGISRMLNHGRASHSETTPCGGKLAAAVKPKKKRFPGLAFDHLVAQSKLEVDSYHANPHRSNYPPTNYHRSAKKAPFPRGKSSVFLQGSVAQTHVWWEGLGCTNPKPPFPGLGSVRIWQNSSWESRSRGRFVWFCLVLIHTAVAQKPVPKCHLGIWSQTLTWSLLLTLKKRLVITQIMVCFFGNPTGTPPSRGGGHFADLQSWLNQLHRAQMSPVFLVRG